MFVLGQKVKIAGYVANFFHEPGIIVTIKTDYMWVTGDISISYEVDFGNLMARYLFRESDLISAEEKDRVKKESPTYGKCLEILNAR